MEFYVYELLDQGVPFYVGKGHARRMKAHEADARRGRQSRLCRHIREIWASGRIVEKKIVYTTPDEANAFQIERERIATIGLDRLDNVSPGGKGWAGNASGMKGKHHSPNVRQKISEALRGRNLSEEHRRKLSMAMNGNCNGKNSKPWNIGKTASVETRRKLSELHSGKPLSAEHCRRISESRRGMKLTAEHRQKLSESHKGQIPWNKGKSTTIDRKV